MTVEPGQGWLGEGEFVNAWIDVRPIESARDRLHQAECGRCAWTVSGLEAACEGAAYDHAADVHRPFGLPAPMLMLSDDGATYVLMPPSPPPPIPIRPVNAPADVPREMRHPTGVDAGWRPFTNTVERLNHIAFGDIIDTLGALGYEVRLQIREKPDAHR